MRPLAILPLLLAAGPALAEPLAVKTGQWAMTTTMHMDGPFLSPEVMAKLPPQARAPMEAAMAQMGQPKTRKSCLTAEKLARGFDLNHGHGHDCQQTLLRQTGTEIEMRTVCTSAAGSTTEHGVFTATDSQTLDGHFDIQRTAAEGPKHITVDIAGKWLGVACTAADGSE